MANISFYGSHNAAIAVEKNNKIIVVIEIERFLNLKNSGYSQYKIANTRPYLLKEIIKWIEVEYGISEYDNCYYLNTDTNEGEIKVFYEQLIPAKNYEQLLHHGAHAACGFYQSPYNEALIVSFDGGGNDGFFNIYYASDRNNITELVRVNKDLGFPYMYFGEHLSDIKKEHDLSTGNLIYSGKIMGLCSYGDIIDEWIIPIKEFYNSNPDGLQAHILFKELMDKIGIEFNVGDRLSGKPSWDLVRTSQFVFEELTIDIINPYLNMYPNIPLIMVGGCGLNIILNNRLRNELDRDVFIPPNPNDCGIASGLLLSKMKPKYQVDLTYSGIPILDQSTLMSHLESLPHHSLCNLQSLSKYISEGKIVGVVRGNSEHGPRALGNRSIICDPTFSNMKDILNQKVKNREWYRPFSPVVRLEDVSKYFEFDGESRWMGFCPLVKEEWREILSSITHVDGTARVQTVTIEQNEWLYNLLTEFEKIKGVGVLLNTSFNIDGKPILSTYADAVNVFKATNIDALVLGDYFVKK